MYTGTKPNGAASSTKGLQFNTNLEKLDWGHESGNGRCGVSVRHTRSEFLEEIGSKKGLKEKRLLGGQKWNRGQT